MDLTKEIRRNKTILVVLDEKQYEDKIIEIVRSLGKVDKKICYLCLNKTYKDMIEDLKNQNIDVKKFFFIDVLSSYYKRQEPRENCIFVPAPTDTVSIMKALTKAVKEKGCEVVVFDTISAFLIYRQNYFVLKFAYKLLQEHVRAKRKVLITLKGGDLLNKEREALIKDLSMFADVSIVIESERKKDFSDKMLSIIMYMI